MVSYKKVFHSLIAVFFLGLIGSFIAYGVRVFFARSLELEQYGLFYAVFALVVVLSSFKDFGMRQALVKYVAEYVALDDYDRVSTALFCSLLFQLCVAIILYGIFWFIAPLLAEHYFKSPEAVMVLRGLSLVFFSSFLFMNARSLLRGLQEMTWFSFADPIRLVGILFLFFLLFPSYGFIAAIIAYILGDIMGFIVLLVPLFKRSSLSVLPKTRVMPMIKQLLHFGIPVTLSGAGDKLLGHLDVIILTVFVALEQIGIYTIILPTALVFLSLGSTLSSVGLPLISSAWVANKNVIIRGIRSTTIYSFAILTPIILLTIFFSEKFLQIFFGDIVTEGVLPFRILLLAALMFTTTKMNFAALAGIGKPFETTKIMCIVVIGNVILNFLLIPWYGILGAAIATMISYGIASLLSTLRVAKYIGFSLPMKELGGIIVGGGVMTGAFFISFRYLQEGVVLFIGVSIISVVLYTVVLFLLRVIKKNDISKLFKEIRKSTVMR